MKQNENVLKEEKNQKILATEIPQTETPKVEIKKIEEEKVEAPKTEIKNVETPQFEIKKQDINQNKKRSGKFMLLGFSILIIIFVLLAVFVTATIINRQNTNIYKGISIKGVEISNLSKEEAKTKLKEYFRNSIPEEIVFKSQNYEASIPSLALEIDFKLDDAVDLAYNVGRDSNIFVNNWNILQANLQKKNIEPVLVVNEEKIKGILREISLNLPDRTIESSYYIEDNNLIITNGKSGYAVDIDKMIPYIKSKVENLELNEEYLKIEKISKEPLPIDIDKIYSEIHKEAKDAYYTQEPYAVFASEDGVDFDISIEDAKAMIKEEKEEYAIPLKILYPSVTTNMIGMEAFPDLLANFSTNYQASNVNRTTNLVLASNKINGTVIMPGEVFSYNKVVGARTIAAGYKEAPIYVSGRVEDGLGGGICQIATTLYNAVVLSNLEIVERSNHQFVPSYIGASRDATVVYGAIDFKFKNNRDYPIKIQCSVSGGIANYKIYGLKNEDDYDVEISARVTGSTANALYSQGYKTLKKDGQIVKTEVLSTDVYKKH